MQCEYYALEGLSALLGTIEQIRAAVNANLELEGILRTMFDPRNNLSNEVSAQLIMHFGDKGFLHDHSAKRPAGGGAVLRPPRVVSLQGLAGRARVSGARWRDDPA